MTYFNQFHKVSSERKMRKIAESKQSPMNSIDAAKYFCNDNGVGHYSNSSFIVWDLIPRNVLSDKDGDIFVVDAEIKRK